MPSNENALFAFGSRPAPAITDKALHLLRSYDVESLGDGNPAAGMNTLVSMCATLCAVAGPDAKIVNNAGDEFPVGINWLVAGSLSSALHTSRVLSPVWQRQANLSESAHLAEQKRAEYFKSQRTKSFGEITGSTRPPSPITPEMMLQAQDSLVFADIIGSGSDFVTPGLAQAASKLLQRRAFSDLPELVRKPAVIHNGNDAKALSKELAWSHRRHPLVDFPVHGLAQAAAMEAACLGVMDGSGVPGKFPAPVKGFCTARMQHDVFAGLVKHETSPAWMKRMLWLVDIPLEPVASPSPKLKLDLMQRRYEVALAGILVDRLSEETTAINWDLQTKTHHAWVAYLEKLESQFPGISGMLAGLVPGLNFGLYQLAVALERTKGFALPIDATMWLAKYLVDRMIHQSLVLREEQMTAFKLKIARSILTKLQDGPHTPRELVRRHDNLPIDLCREILAELRSSSVVRANGDRWELLHPTITSNPTPPVIDVP